MKHWTTRLAVTLATLVAAVGFGAAPAHAGYWQWHSDFTSTDNPGCWQTGENGWNAGYWLDWYCEPLGYVEITRLYVYYP